ncbi:putative ABC multidrug transporter [Xylogone sp. PMI_703]|nr:putative ABC multidrug transporter [Xylogone sp. PMI_703]
MNVNSDTRRDSKLSGDITPYSTRDKQQRGIDETRADLKKIATETGGLDSGDPALDPTSSSFNAEKWARAVCQRADRINVKFRRTSIAFKNLMVSGSAAVTYFQPTVGSIFMTCFRLNEYFSFGNRPEKTILNRFDGILNSGEMLLVLGRPGSGCSTFLKTLSGELHGLNISNDSSVNYNGIPRKEMVRHHKGEIVYNSEVDKHFPHLTVRQTLEFAATVRTPRSRVLGPSRKQRVEQVTAVAMSICNLYNAADTKVGNDFVRGVSGGERKRVSIAEMILSSSSIGCWDNSTRGLDSATALDFVRALRMSAHILGTTHAVALYQASQAIYDVFDKVIVLYDGREIFYGPANLAKSYFEEMGWCCPTRQTTGDFLTSVTNHKERKPRPGFETQVPRSAEDFEKYWMVSKYREALLKEMNQYEHDISDQTAANEFRASRRAMQSRYLRPTSPYTVSIPMQIKACTKRAYQLLWNDKPATLTVVLGQIIMALVVGSVFFGTPNNTGSFFARGSTLFFAVLLNALIAITEINNLYQQRPIVEKHTSYAFYHPFTEALAGIISDAPVKLIIATFFNLILYFLAGLRVEASNFFIFFLFTVIIRFTMSAMFRTVAAVTKTVSQAMAIAGVLVLAIVIYTGYTIPRSYMKPWFKWIIWINPLSYAFEALMVNEFHGTDFPCSSLVPNYPNLAGQTFICSVPGSIAGQTTVSGDAYVETSFQYSYSHLWRNLGIVIGFWVFFLVLYLVATEFSSPSSSGAEVLLFLRSIRPNDASGMSPHTRNDEQSKAVDGGAQVPAKSAMESRPGTFMWRNVVYDICIKDKPRRLLDHVSGWVKPGTLTALMGVSGAGKTTLLDVLARRTSIGVISGDMSVNGRPLDSNFQRQTGYVQQQDVHLETSTVREALRFSAVLRQSSSVPTKEKYDHVEDIIEMLDMHDFADAIIGIPGKGLNVEQRKLLSIGVELAAKPALLIFLDEPTSGLDSQSSWAIVGFLRKLANSGQAILATIHQPSSMLFLEFDRLLFLAKGGKTVYFGEIGRNAKTLLSYFEHNGARSCNESENPAEYILEMVNAQSTDEGREDWPQIWNSSEEFIHVKREQERICEELGTRSQGTPGAGDHREFATPLSTQTLYTTIRMFQQYWRTPSYVLGKYLLGIVSALFIGFSFFQSNNSLQGTQNIIFSIFMLTAILSSMSQIMPRFVLQRSLYEVRERPSKMYSWFAFMFSNIIVEFPFQILLGILVYACYYYPIYGVQSSESQGLILLFCIQIFLFASTYAHMVISVLPDAQTAGALATLMFSLTMIFNGVFQPPQALPGFWIFMYRVSPLTYIVSGIAATGLGDRLIRCSVSETSVFNPNIGLDCGLYLQPFLSAAPGQLYNPSATSGCQYCPLSNTKQFLSQSSISLNTRWRNFGIVWAYIVFNGGMAILLYYLFRVRKWKWSRGKLAKILGQKLISLFLLLVGYIKLVFSTWWGQKPPVS